MELSVYLKQCKDENKKATLNLGCGKTCPPDHFGMDIQDAAGVDRVVDLSKSIPSKDNLFDVVVAIDFLEHIEPTKNIRIMEEIYRVLKPGGELHTVVPSTDGNNVGAFQDPTHISFWNRNKFMYFLDGEYGNNFRSLYNIQCWFKPELLETYYNEYGVTYVRALLRKEKEDK